MYPLISTPRLAKRFVNLYRLLRIRATQQPFDFQRFVDKDGGEYASVALLLAMNVGSPDITGKILRAISERGLRPTTAEFIDQLTWDDDKKALNSVFFQQLGIRAGDLPDLSNTMQSVRDIRESLINKKVPFSEDNEILSKWTKEILRYSYTWHSPS